MDNRDDEKLNGCEPEADGVNGDGKTDLKEPASPPEKGESGNGAAAPADPSESAEVSTEVSVGGQKTGAPASGEIAPPKKKKKIASILWNVFFVLIIALGIFSVFGIAKEIDPDAEISFSDAMRGSSPLFMCLLVAVVLIIMALDIAKYCIINKTVTGKFRVGAAAKTNFLGKYYDAVTPFATGGQPMQIYYLNTKGVSGGNSTAIVMIKYFSGIICWVFLGAALMIWGTAKGILAGVPQGKLLTVAGWIGIAINLVLPVFVTLCLILPKVMYKLTRGVVKLGAKMKIVKDVDRAIERAFKVVNDFRNSFKLMATSPVKLIALMLLNAVEAFLTFAVPFFVMKAFSSPVDGKIITVMALNAFAIFGVSFVPTPGNTGVVESLGSLAFSVATGSVTVWAVLFWRLAVFYIYIIIGLGISVFDMVLKNIRKKKDGG